ncbi:MAG: Gfo/Idh/MocA family oxidoreductase [Gemmataceae bacterium]
MPRITRRSFLAASGAVAAVPFVKAYAPGERKDKVRLAVIGAANRGQENWSQMLTDQVVAICDVDPKHTERLKAKFPDAAVFTDYRKLFDAAANTFDAAVVSTPDHTHAGPAVRAMRLGKHVYCEKPLASTVEEVRVMRRVAAETKVVTQMGTQIHAGDNYRRVVEIVKSGALGPISKVQVWLGSGPQPGKLLTSPANVPFDLDVWLGPVAEPFFHADHSRSPYKHPWPHFHWRYWWQFAGGQLGDFGCHYMDLPFWALGLGLPTTVAATGSPMPNADNTVPGKMRVDYTFPAAGDRGPVQLTWFHGVPGPDLDGKVRFDGFGSGVRFEGTKGVLLADYGKHKLLPDEFAKSVKPPAQTIPKSIGHQQEWLAAIRGEGKTLCEFGYSGTLAEAVLLGNVAYRAGKPITWDGAAGKVTDVPEANQYVGRAVRKGWELG